MPPAELTDHLFRRSAGRIVALLTRILGPGQLSLAEDAVQDAMLKALQTWPYQGIPRNPAGWLYRVARNRAFDETRRSATLTRKLAGALRDTGSAGPLGDDAFDDQLTMMFLSCHPALTGPMRVGLTLKVVAGFGTGEIAAAFLVPRATVQQRLVRARRILRETGARFAMPPDRDLPARLDDVLTVLYLTFNEGYAASTGDAPVRAELCGEAIRLASALAEHPLTDRPVVHALLALMYFQSSRLEARTDEMGRLVLLDDQDRSRWDRRAIMRGLRHLERAASGSTLTGYHLEAGIASCHAIAPSAAATDWRQILDYYDRLLDLEPSPIVRLNRAVAVARVSGPAAGLEELRGLERHRSMRRYHLLPAVRAWLLEQAGRRRAAAAAWRRAITLARTGPEQALLRRRLRSLKA